MANDITLPRGNSLELVITPYIDDDETTEYVLTGNDKVYFTVKSNAESSRVYLSKTLSTDNYNTENKLILKLSPEDTNDLATFCYAYDCALQRDNTDGDFYTFVKTSKFEVTPALSQKITEEVGE